MLGAPCSVRSLSRSCGGGPGWGLPQRRDSLTSLGTLPRKRGRGKIYPLAAPTLENRLRMRINRVSQTSR